MQSQLSRRTFLQLTAGTMAGAVLAACAPPAAPAPAAEGGAAPAAEKVTLNVWWFDDPINLAMIQAYTSIGIGLMIGLPAALVLARTQFAGHEALMSLLLLPLVVPGIVLGIALYVFQVEAEIATGLPLLGSLGGLLAGHVLIVIPWTVRLVSASLAGLDRSIEEAAQSLGVQVSRLRLMVIAGVALGVGGSVAVAGTIAFIGLVAPHLMRPLVSYDPARLMVPSALAGAALQRQLCRGRAHGLQVERDTAAGRAKFPFRA